MSLSKNCDTEGYWAAALCVENTRNRLNLRHFARYSARTQHRCRYTDSVKPKPDERKLVLVELALHMAI